MSRHLTLLAVAFALVFSGLVSATKDTVRVEGGLISGTTADGVHSFKGVPQEKKIKTQ
jgi:hypothetical protein